MCLALVPAFAFDNFISREGDTLMDGDKAFRFLGLAAANLHQNGEGLLPDYTNRFPNEYEIRDTLATIKQMGGLATRSFTLSFRSYDPEHIDVPVYINGISDYNEEAFRTLDKVLQIANELGIRIIIPLIDSHDFWGWWGIKQFAGFRGKHRDEFWTDPVLRQDFKNYISDLVNRVNVYTGVPYKQEKAILAWQLGNEFESFIYDNNYSPETWLPIIDEFSRDIAAHIKSVDANHLVMEGGGDWARLLADPNIDIMSRHYYVHWSGEQDLYRWCEADKVRSAQNDKAFIVDEFGMGATPDIERLMQMITFGQLGAVEDNQYVDGKLTSGGLLWGMRSHRRDGGFYLHNEAGGYRSYHWPGFPSAEDQDESNLLRKLRDYAFAARQMARPETEVPSAPAMLPITSRNLSWQGSAGAAAYDLQRAEAPEGPWSTVAATLYDDKLPPLYTDSDAQNYKPYYYRVIAKNKNKSQWQYSLPSVEQGPITFYPSGEITDTLVDFSLMADSSSNLFFDDSNPDYFGDDYSRLTRIEAQPASIVYHSESGFLAFEMESYFWPYEDLSDFQILISPDNEVFNPLMPVIEEDGTNWKARRYRQLTLPPQSHYLRIVFPESENSWNPQIGRVVLKEVEQRPLVDVAAAKPVTVSSRDGWGHGAQSLTDNDPASRWASAWQDDQFVIIDLQGLFNVERIHLDWEEAYARTYQISTSSDGDNWEIQFVQASGAGGLEHVELQQHKVRFIRLDFGERGTQWGFSLWDIAVMGR